MPDSPDLSRRNFLKLTGILGLGAAEAPFMHPPLSVEIPPVHIHLLNDPQQTAFIDMPERLVAKREHELFEQIADSAKKAGVQPDLIGVSSLLGYFNGAPYYKAQIWGDVESEPFGGAFAPVLIDAIVSKDRAATLVTSGDDANLYEVKKVTVGKEDGRPKIEFVRDTLGGPVVKGLKTQKDVGGVMTEVFSLIEIEGSRVPDDKLRQAVNLFGKPVFSSDSAMARAAEDRAKKAWYAQWLIDLKLGVDINNPTKRIFTVGKVIDQLKNGTASDKSTDLAVVNEKTTLPWNKDEDIEIGQKLATVEQKIQADTGNDALRLVLYQAGDPPSGGAAAQIATADSATMSPREETQNASVLADLTPKVDKETGNVIWTNKNGDPLFVSLLNKPGLYRVTNTKKEPNLMNVEVGHPVVGDKFVAPVLARVPSEAAIANFKPMTFEAAVVGKIPDAWLQKLLKGKNSEIPNLVKSLEGNKNRHPNTVYLQATRAFGGAPLFGVIGLAADVLGLGEMVVDLPRETMPDAETPVTAKIIYVSLLDEPTKPFPVIAGFSYGIKTGKIEIGSPIILRRDSRLAPDKEHRFGSSNLYRVVFTLGSDRVSLINGTVPQIPEGPNKQFYQRIGQRLKDYFGIAATEDVKKDLVFDGQKGDYTDGTYSKLLTNVKDRPIKLAELINYYA